MKQHVLEKKQEKIHESLIWEQQTGGMEKQDYA